MLTELYEAFKPKRKDAVEKVITTGGELTGAGIGCKIGTYIGAFYAVSKEVCSVITTQQIYSPALLALEYLAIVGAASLTGKYVGRKAIGKVWNFFSRSRKGGE